MFTVSALGHQGWLIGNEGSHLLVDPQLGRRFSRMPTSGALLFPPRVLDLAGFPPIDAVLVTHEHPDHLDFASLQLLDSRTPVYLSAHTSMAARRVISSLGLEVRALVPGVETIIGELSVLPFAPPVIAGPGSNEVDVVPLLIRDRSGHGSFFTSVDLSVREESIRALRAHLDRPGTWADANSGYDRSLHYDWVRRSTDPVNEAARLFVERYLRTFDGWGHPEIVLVTENGFSLGNDLVALDPHVFEVPNDAFVAAVRALLPGHEVREALPGTTADMLEGELVAIRASLPYLATDDVTRWPTRGGAPLQHANRHEFGPATGVRAMPEEDHIALQTALGELARFLFARTTFRGLYRLTAGTDHSLEIRPTIALVLRDDARPRVYEYRPTEAAFVSVDCADPIAQYVAGAEMWAADLLAVLTYRACPVDVFHFGRKHLWNHASAVLQFDLDTEIELFAHALRSPIAAERLYRRGLDVAVRPVLRGPSAVNGSEGKVFPSWPRRPPKARALPDSSAVGESRGHAQTTSERDVSSPPDARTARLAEAIALGSQGAWVLSQVRTASALLVLEIALPAGARLQIQAGPIASMPRHYQRLGTLAFAYGPGAIDDETRATLDRVIVSVANTLESL